MQFRSGAGVGTVEWFRILFKPGMAAGPGFFGFLRPGRKTRDPGWVPGLKIFRAGFQVFKFFVRVSFQNFLRNLVRAHPWLKPLSQIKLL